MSGQGECPRSGLGTAAGAPTGRTRSGVGRRSTTFCGRRGETRSQVDSNGTEAAKATSFIGGERFLRKTRRSGVPVSRPELPNADIQRQQVGSSGSTLAATSCPNTAGTSSAAERVQVAVRCRPFAQDRKQASGEPLAQAVRVNELLREVRVLQPAYLSGAPFSRASSTGASGNAAAVSCPPHGAAMPCSETDVDNLPPYATRSFSYDRVFPMSAGQEQVYDALVRPIVSDSILGYNCTIFAYGQTGTGKTYTMEGGPRSLSIASGTDSALSPAAGIIPRAARQIFSSLHGRSSDIEYTVRCSHLELYNEQLSDLLVPGGSTQTMRILQDPSKGTFVSGLEEIVVRNEHEITVLLEKSSQRRHTAETSLNRYSSRSHAIFTITIHVRETTPDGEDLLRVGKLNLVDLAGSENIGRSGATSERAREAGSINQSLLTLGRVINSLIEGHGHVPYRDSKLTRLLQESLGGRNKTAIIATISPEISDLEETLNTLDYAFRAKNIRNRPTLNQMLMKKTLLREYTEEIARLRLELEATRTKNGIYVPPELYAEMEEARQAHRDRIAALEQQIQDRAQEKEVLERMLDESRSQLLQAQERQQALEQALEARDAEMNQVQQRLALVSTQLDESRYLLDERAKNEEQLAREAVALMNNLSQSLHDLDIVHRKLEERDKKYNSFFDRVRETQATSQETIEQIRSEVRRLEEQLSVHGAALQTQFERCLFPPHGRGGDREPSSPNKENSNNFLLEENHGRNVCPSPETPKRRPWRYPRRLTRTAEETVLLAAYRQRVAEARPSDDCCTATQRDDDKSSDTRAQPAAGSDDYRAPTDTDVHTERRERDRGRHRERSLGVLTTDAACTELVPAHQRRTWAGTRSSLSAAETSPS
ncbi:hypothetical protein CCYA_CCYA12G3411 [Cyanidiococcus yangmingshanensis]|nr:hypothetical protein CCYA_CCYA12G3411 [Cyanidiococcus yangmingshanensis]